MPRVGRREMAALEGKQNLVKPRTRAEKKTEKKALEALSQQPAFVEPANSCYRNMCVGLVGSVAVLALLAMAHVQEVVIPGIGKI